ncbi:signal recognition particle-docking protein FtsY [Candidatus Legionella polyplacis]|uniref:Signal recognition particle-docking protein FtsY n=1 Tax=Candidatus Legionella polyplacis TaxID=2005262 RepID=A0ABZ2GWI1_9GAMM
MNLFEKLKFNLDKTKNYFKKNLLGLFKKNNNGCVSIEELEELLIKSDVGLSLSKVILNDIKLNLRKEKYNDYNEVIFRLSNYMESFLEKNEGLFNDFDISNGGPYTILVVGVNGVGKTTIIGKLSRYYKTLGKSIALCAGDTFRSGAIEQIKYLANINDVRVIFGKYKSDSASVVYNAMQISKSEKVDMLFIDTSGRLHTEYNLMSELKKIKRVLFRIDNRAPNEVLLVLDATLGQSTLNQVRKFNDFIGVTGIVMTKLDSTSKGGILFNIANEFDIPFRYLSFGEKMDDISPFNAKLFVKSFFDINKNF